MPMSENTPKQSSERDFSAITELSELITLIEALPEELQENFKNAIVRTVENIDRHRKILAFVQEALGQLRLDMKYLMFDLDATRRERDELHAQLKELLE